MNLTTCTGCGYPHVGSACSNPGCFDNPHVSEAQKALWLARNLRLKVEEEERQRIADIRKRSRARG